MEPKLGEITDVLSRTPAVLTALLAGMGSDLLTHRAAPDSFSPMDVLGHLIHGEKTDWVPRIKLILATGDTVPFMAFDRRGFEEAIRGRSAEDLLVELTALRQANLKYLAGLRLASGQLSLAGRHPELGRVTLGQLLATWAAHDLNHVDQVARVVCDRYAEAVGPWRAYLGILNR
jgi:DinB superfamily